MSATNIETFLSAIRKIETGSYEGEYLARGKPVAGTRPVGAYGILESEWAAWAAKAGIAGADWRDPRAQDRVASERAQTYFERFGSWDLAAIAWIGGGESVRKVVQRGWDGPSSIHNKEIRSYLESFQAAAPDAPDLGRALGRAKMTQFAQTATPKAKATQSANAGWVMPVAGANEYSGGSWMPDSHTHRGRTHAAIDVYAEEGTPIVSPVSGKVLSTKKSEVGGYTARVQGDDGIIYYFAHMQDAAVVGAGQKLQAGHHIGYVGRTGSAKRTKPHLHFSMKRANGEAINPKSYLDGSSNIDFQGPTGDAFGSSINESAGTQMNKLLEEVSNRIAGGKRDPSILEAPDPTLDETPTTAKNEDTE